MDRLHRELWSDRSNLPRRHRHRSARRKTQFLVERQHWIDGVLGTVSWLPAARTLRLGMAMAASTDRWYRALHHVRRGRVCGDDRDGLQPDRTWKDHSCRVL